MGGGKTSWPGSSTSYVLRTKISHPSARNSCPSTTARPAGAHSVQSRQSSSQHVMNSLSLSPQVVPGLYSLGSPASTPQSSPGGSLDVPWFARPPQSGSCSEEEMYPHYPHHPLQPAEPLNLSLRRPRRKTSLCSVKEPKLPSDPRRWSRAEVCSWVEWTCLSHSLPSPSVDRFLMNGKAVCLMSVQMFSNRVPLGGKLLYRDFQIRLAKAVNNLKNI